MLSTRKAAEALDQIATAIIQHTALDQTRHIAALIELGVDA